MAPVQAKRFSVFLGVRPCTGKIRFAGLRIDTLSGDLPVKARMPDDVTYEPIDLTAFFNRDLDTNVTGPLDTVDLAEPDQSQ